MWGCRRMSLSNQNLNDIGEVELPFFGGDPGEEDDLEKKVPEFLLQFFRRSAFDRLQDFIGFLDEIFFQGLLGLLPVPGTSRGAAQPGHDSQELGLYRSEFPCAPSGGGSRLEMSFLYS